MNKGTVCEGTAEQLCFPNKAYVHVKEPEEADVMVKNLLPGQRVKIRISKKKKGKYEGQLLEILEPSPLETQENPCVHAGICGGCVYQTLPYETELDLKKNQVLNLLRPVVHDIDKRFEGIHPSPSEQSYRNKMEYTFGDEYQNGPLALGMHKRGAFYDIVPAAECRIAAPDFGKILATTQNYFAENKIPFYQRMKRRGYLRHLLVRRAAGTGEILVDLVTTSQKEFDTVTEEKLLDGWVQTLRNLSLNGALTGLLHTVNDSCADAVINEETHILYGQDYFTELCLGLKFNITPFSFFQTNSGGAEVLYETARNFISNSLEKKPGTLFDLYSGTGTIAQILAPAAQHVIGVEIVPEAVEAAKINASRNGLENCDFIAGDVLKVLETIEERPDLIVLDPPREGVHPKALKRIISYHVPSMLYISCKPTSLARDLVTLQYCGYRVQRACCVDMFPKTANVETVVLMSRKNQENVRKH